jgi:hypothetical protein
MLHRGECRRGRCTYLAAHHVGCNVCSPLRGGQHEVAQHLLNTVQPSTDVPEQPRGPEGVVPVIEVGPLWAVDYQYRACQHAPQNSYHNRKSRVQRCHDYQARGHLCGGHPDLLLTCC